MGRAWEIQHDGAYYNGLSLENERQDIFCDYRDRIVFLETLGETSNRAREAVLKNQGAAEKHARAIERLLRHRNQKG